MSFALVASVTLTGVTAAQLYDFRCDGV